MFLKFFSTINFTGSKYVFGRNVSWIGNKKRLIGEYYVAGLAIGVGIDLNHKSIMQKQEYVLGEINVFREAIKQLKSENVNADMVHIFKLKPFEVTELMVKSLKNSGAGLVIDSDFEVGGVARNIAYDLMHASGVPVFAMGLEERTGGFAPHST